jgi:AraC-like DNA-binding protein
MKVLPFKIPKSENTTLLVQEDVGKLFYDKLHQHSEIQISIIIKGEGTLIIGDYVGDFKANDIFVIGENLPHVFKSDTSIAHEVKMISLFFTKSSFGESFFLLPEFFHLNTLFTNAKTGFEVISNKARIIELFLTIKTDTKFYRFITFLNILNLISESNINSLSSFINIQKYTENEGKRMNAILQYSLTNFNNNITLHKISNIANMTANAFCRYFKQRTNKTYFDFLLDIKIGNACKLLLKKGDLSIHEIAFKSGFNNISNFNRKFKALKKMTPSEFRKRH